MAISTSEIKAGQSSSSSGAVQSSIEANPTIGLESETVNAAIYELADDIHAMNSTTDLTLLIKNFRNS